MMRTHMAGKLGATDIGTDVTLCGWVASRRDHGGVVFLDVRDVSGIVQVVVDPSQAGGEDAHRVRDEFVVRITGTVRSRPDGTRNPDLATGDIEVSSVALEVLSESDPLPFQLSQADDVDEVLRLRHRYLDLRRPRLAGNLRLRANGESRAAHVDGRPGLHRGRDADADRLDSRGCA